MACRTTAIAIAVVLPWIVFTVTYYGTPVPHTIAAKAAGYAQAPPLSAGPAKWISYLRHEPSHARLWKDYAPFYEDVGTLAAPGGRAWVETIALGIWALALIGLRRTWRVPGWRPAIVFAVVYFLYVVFGGTVDWFSWYLPPLVTIVVLLAGAGLTAIGRKLPALAAVLAIGLGLAYAVQNAWLFPMERKVQGIEDHVRQPLGEYLHQVVGPGQAVASESAGYVGYYGRLKLYDYPGLTSPTALRAVRSIPRGSRDFGHLAAVLHPEWMVMRPFEANELLTRARAVYHTYKIVGRAFVPGGNEIRVGALRWWTIDRDFLVLRRRDVKPLAG